MSDEIAAATNVLNIVAATTFFTLAGATLFSMLRRVHLYRQAKLPLPALLRALIVLFASLVVVGGTGAVLRALGVQMEPGTIERFAYTAFVDAVLLSALLYYTKVELFDLDDEDKP